MLGGVSERVQDKAGSRCVRLHAGEPRGVQLSAGQVPAVQEAVGRPEQVQEVQACDQSHLVLKSTRGHTKMWGKGDAFE